MSAHQDDITDSLKHYNQTDYGNPERRMAIAKRLREYADHFHRAHSPVLSQGERETLELLKDATLELEK